MSLESGIQVSDNLQSIFGKAATDGNVRWIRVEIVNENTMDVTATGSSDADFETGLNQVAEALKDGVPCYVLYRKDEQSAETKAYEWLLFCFVPDALSSSAMEKHPPGTTAVRVRMLYASTRGTLRRQLGSSYFKADIHGTVPEDFSKEGYDAHLKHQDATAPLTTQEEMVQEEQSGGIFEGGAGASSAYVHGVAFEVDPNAIAAVKELKNGGSYNYVQLEVDVNGERVILAEKAQVDVASLGSKVPLDEPRFHFYNFAHTHDGKSLNSLIYVYSCPDGSGGTQSAPVKHRMLYSSSKSNVAAIATNQGLTIDGKLEINNGTEWTEESMMFELHPPEAVARPTFKRPTRPGRPGRR